MGFSVLSYDKTKSETSEKKSHILNVEYFLDFLSKFYKMLELSDSEESIF